MADKTIEQRLETLLSKFGLDNQATVSDARECQLMEGGVIKIVTAAGGDIIMDSEGIPLPQGSYELTDKRKILVGLSGRLIKILKPGQFESTVTGPQFRVVDQKEKEVKLFDIQNNFKDLIKFRNS